jgi:hypothetical protein
LLLQREPTVRTPSFPSADIVTTKAFMQFNLFWCIALECPVWIEESGVEAYRPKLEGAGGHKDSPQHCWNDDHQKDPCLRSVSFNRRFRESDIWQSKCMPLYLGHTHSNIHSLSFNYIFNPPRLTNFDTAIGRINLGVLTGMSSSYAVGQF